MTDTNTTLDSPDDDAVTLIRTLCLSFPEAVEQPFGGHTAPSFRIRDKLFATISEDHSFLTCKAAPGVQQALIAAQPARYFVPAYVGSKGWVGVHLNTDYDWQEVAELITDSYRMIAPKRLAAMLAPAS